MKKERRKKGGGKKRKEERRNMKWEENEEGRQGRREGKGDKNRRKNYRKSEESQKIVKRYLSACVEYGNRWRGVAWGGGGGGGKGRSDSLLFSRNFTIFFTSSVPNLSHGFTTKIHFTIFFFSISRWKKRDKTVRIFLPSVIGPSMNAGTRRERKKAKWGGEKEKIEISLNDKGF